MILPSERSHLDGAESKLIGKIMQMRLAESVSRLDASEGLIMDYSVAVACVDFVSGPVDRAGIG
jgi:hypothetical protein